MPTSLLPVPEASRFYQLWLNADFENRTRQINALSENTLSTVDFSALLQNETDTGIPLPRAMRRLRNLIVCALIYRDLSGKADLNEVLATITAFAEFTIQTLLATITQEAETQYGIPIGTTSGQRQELIVLGMGKLGGSELNVSSDIDLIFVFPENGETKTIQPNQRSLSNQEFFTRVGKRLINAISEISEDGYIFRVDMALRPNGTSGPLVCSINSLEQYFIVQGREWERYAWIKARAITGSPSDIKLLKKVVIPFVYRRYLDYNVIDAIRNMHQQIRSEVMRQEKLHPDRNNNVKLSRGGIREIEFLTQVFQLIRGGRDIELRNRSTREMLKILAKKRQIDQSISEQLLISYTFLRNLEHRLQYLDDAQTHSLPSNPNDIVIIAKSMGYETSETLFEELQKHRDFVAGQFDAIFSDKSSEEETTVVLDHPLSLNQNEQEQLDILEGKLAQLNFSETKSIAKLILSFWKINRIQALSDTVQNRLLMLINHVLPQIANCKKPTQTLSRLLDFFESIARRSAYLSLLMEYPIALTRLIRMIDASDWAAQYLTIHPILLDELLDARTLLSPPDWETFSKELDAQLTIEKGDPERQMDLLRDMHHALLFRLLAQDLEGALSVEHLADHLSKLADIIIEAAIKAAWQNMPTRHIEIPKFAVIAYGKLGGKELGYASDLDIIFLYDDNNPEAPILYSRLAQRFITWMTTPTGSGRLFDVDLELRPDGASGLMVSSITSFEKYQKTSAWTWEHQALTRARFCAGDPKIGKKFERIREEILKKDRDLSTLRNDVLSIRQKMHDGHPNRSTLFDLKHDSGGMIDIEFIVQFLILKYAKTYPELTGNIGNIALLVLCEKLGLIPKNLGQTVANIYRNFRRKQHHIRLQGADVSRVKVESVQEEIESVKKLWDFVFTA